MIRVLIADDEFLVRTGVRTILEAAGDIAVVGEAGDGDEAVQAVTLLRPQVVLLDVRMPGMDGLSSAEWIGRLPNPPKVVMLTTFDLDEYVHRALRAGAVGFLLKDTPPFELAAAVRTVAAGDAILSPSVTKRLISTFTAHGPDRVAEARDRLAQLTERERDVVQALAQGLSNAEIARALSLSEATVKGHVSHALSKLGLGNRVQAAILAHDAGLV